MSTQNEDKSTVPLLGVPADHPANAGMIDGAPVEQDTYLTIPAVGPISPARMQLRDAPPLEWPAPASQQAVVDEKARFHAVKDRVVDADPATFGSAERFAQDVARGERAAQQASTPSTAEPAAASPKTRRARTTKAKTADEQDKVGETKPKRTSSKKTSKGESAPEQHVPAQGTSAVGSNMPDITPEAIGFLSNPDALAANLFKLSPGSQDFVQFYLKDQAQRDDASKLELAWLMENSRPVSPATQQFVDALLATKKRAAVTVDTTVAPAAAVKVPAPAAVSFAPRRATVLAPASIQLGQVDIAADKASGPVAREDAPLDIKSAHLIAGTGNILMSAPINDLTPKEAAELVMSDLEVFRAIKDPKARGIALNAVAEASEARPRYKADFERQAPDLAGELAAAEKQRSDDWTKVFELSQGLNYVLETDKQFTPEEAGKLAGEDIKAIRSIKDDQLRDQALSDSFLIGEWQPQYRAAFVEQAPDLIEPARAARAATRALEEQQVRDAKVPDNSIERGPVLEKQVAAQQPAPQAAAMAAAADKPVVPPADRVADAVPLPSAGKRLLRFLGSSTQKVGSWLADRSTEVLALPAVPVLLSKPADPVVAAAPAADPKPAVMPDAIARRFLKVEQDYYFPDKTHAFADRGNKLSTRGHHPEVVRALVDVAKARGWDSIVVKGTDDFKRSAWMEAAQSGVKVAGYQPTPLDLAELSQRPARNSVENGTAKEKTVAPAPTPVEQQAAKDAANVTPVDPTAAVQVGPQAAPKADELKPDPEHVAMAKSFQNDKASFVVKKYPHLAGAFGIVEAAKAFAAENLPKAAHEEFVGMARTHVIQKITTGQQISGPKIYLAPNKVRDSPDQAKAGGADLEKSPRTKEVARER
jgi:hypothetical protein